MKSTIRLVVQLVGTLGASAVGLWLLPQDLSLTLIAVSQSFTFFFMGYYGSFHIIAVVLAAFVTAFLGIPLLVLLGSRLNQPWIFIPSQSLLIAVGATNFVSYIFGLFFTRKQERRDARELLARSDTFIIVLPPSRTLLASGNEREES